MKTIVILIFGGITLIIISIILFIKFKSSSEIKKLLSPILMFILGVTMLISSIYFQFKLATSLTKPANQSITIKLDTSGLNVDTIIQH